MNAFILGHALGFVLAAPVINPAENGKKKHVSGPGRRSDRKDSPDAETSVMKRDAAARH